MHDGAYLEMHGRCCMGDAAWEMLHGRCMGDAAWEMHAGWAQRVTCVHGRHGVVVTAWAPLWLLQGTAGLLQGTAVAVAAPSAVAASSARPSTPTLTLTGAWRGAPPRRSAPGSSTWCRAASGRPPCTPGRRRCPRPPSAPGEGGVRGGSGRFGVCGDVARGAGSSW